ncbi:MAG: hypothetical protein ACOC5T_04775, partial [Elusimicrobiota bacterium]
YEGTWGNISNLQQELSEVETKMVKGKASTADYQQIKNQLESEKLLLRELDSFINNIARTSSTSSRAAKEAEESLSVLESAFSSIVTFIQNFDKLPSISKGGKLEDFTSLMGEYNQISNITERIVQVLLESSKVQDKTTLNYEQAANISQDISRNALDSIALVLDKQVNFSSEAKKAFKDILQKVIGIDWSFDDLYNYLSGLITGKIDLDSTQYSTLIDLQKLLPNEELNKKLENIIQDDSLSEAIAPTISFFKNIENLSKEFDGRLPAEVTTLVTESVSIMLINLFSALLGSNELVKLADDITQKISVGIPDFNELFDTSYSEAELVGLKAKARFYTDIANILFGGTQRKEDLHKQRAQQLITAAQEFDKQMSGYIDNQVEFVAENQALLAFLDISKGAFKDGYITIDEAVTILDRIDYYGGLEAYAQYYLTMGQRMRDVEQRLGELRGEKPDLDLMHSSLYDASNFFIRTYNRFRDIGETLGQRFGGLVGDLLSGTRSLQSVANKISLIDLLKWSFEYQENDYISAAELFVSTLGDSQKEFESKLDSWIDTLDVQINTEEMTNIIEQGTQEYVKSIGETTNDINEGLAFKVSTQYAYVAKAIKKDVEEADFVALGEDTAEPTVEIQKELQTAQAELLLTEQDIAEYGKAFVERNKGNIQTLSNTLYELFGGTWNSLIDSGLGMMEEAVSGTESMLLGLVTGTGKVLGGIFKGFVESTVIEPMLNEITKGIVQKVSTITISNKFIAESLPQEIAEDLAFAAATDFTQLFIPLTKLLTGQIDEIVVPKDITTLFPNVTKVLSSFYSIEGETRDKINENLWRVYEEILPFEQLTQLAEKMDAGKLFRDESKKQFTKDVEPLLDQTIDTVAELTGISNSVVEGILVFLLRNDELFDKTLEYINKIQARMKGITLASDDANMFFYGQVPDTSVFKSEEAVVKAQQIKGVGRLPEISERANIEESYREYLASIGINPATEELLGIQEKFTTEQFLPHLAYKREEILTAIYKGDVEDAATLLYELENEFLSEELSGKFRKDFLQALIKAYDSDIKGKLSLSVSSDILYDLDALETALDDLSPDVEGLTKDTQDVFDKYKDILGYLETRLINDPLSEFEQTILGLEGEIVEFLSSSFFEKSDAMARVRTILDAYKGIDETWVDAYIRMLKSDKTKEEQQVFQATAEYESAKEIILSRPKTREVKNLGDLKSSFEYSLPIEAHRYEDYLTHFGQRLFQKGFINFFNAVSALDQFVRSDRGMENLPEMDSSFLESAIEAYQKESDKKTREERKFVEYFDEVFKETADAFLLNADREEDNYYTLKKYQEVLAYLYLNKDLLVARQYSKDYLGGFDEVSYNTLMKMAGEYQRTGTLDEKYFPFSDKTVDETRRELSNLLPYLSLYADIDKELLENVQNYSFPERKKGVRSKAPFELEDWIKDIEDLLPKDVSYQRMSMKELLTSDSDFSGKAQKFQDIILQLLGEMAVATVDNVVDEVPTDAEDFVLSELIKATTAVPMPIEDFVDKMKDKLENAMNEMENVLKQADETTRLSDILDIADYIAKDFDLDLSETSFFKAILLLGKQTEKLTDTGEFFYSVDWDEGIKALNKLSFDRDYLSFKDTVLFKNLEQFENYHTLVSALFEDFRETSIEDMSPEEFHKLFSSEEYGFDSELLSWGTSVFGSLDKFKEVIEQIDTFI